MRTLHVTRYVTPLREGGSMPAIVEADDDGLYVLKFRGAGQGAKTLIAELVSGAIAERLGLPIPERVLAHLDPDLGRTEPDPEIQDLIQGSGGVNLALDYLPSAANFDPAVDSSLVDAELASRIVWFDAFVTNVDRTPRNTNMLVWHDKVWLIDNGASLYFHHRWNGSTSAAANPFEYIKDHVLLSSATDLTQASEDCAASLTEAFFTETLSKVPDDWLSQRGSAEPEPQRAAYVAYFMARLEARALFVKEATDARDL